MRLRLGGVLAILAGPVGAGPATCARLAAVLEEFAGALVGGEDS
jgi:hypothetical protein